VALALAGLALSEARASSLDTLMRDFGVGPLSGEPSPVVLPDLAGRPVTLGDQRGRVVLLYFWATWCPYCTKEMPTSLQALHTEFRDQGLAILAINLAEPRAQVEAWVREHGLTFPVLLDGTGAVSSSYRVRATPTVILIDRRGQLLGRAVGSREWDTEGRALIAALLAARP
jgi:peroxiredoxin